MRGHNNMNNNFKKPTSSRNRLKEFPDNEVIRHIFKNNYIWYMQGDKRSYVLTETQINHEKMEILEMKSKWN